MSSHHEWVCLYICMAHTISWTQTLTTWQPDKRAYYIMDPECWQPDNLTTWQPDDLTTWQPDKLAGPCLYPLCLIGWEKFWVSLYLVSNCILSHSSVWVLALPPCVSEGGKNFGCLFSLCLIVYCLTVVSGSWLYPPVSHRVEKILVVSFPCVS